MVDYGLERCPELADCEKLPGETIAVPFEWAAKLRGDTIDGDATYELLDGLTEESTAAAGSLTEIVVSGGTDGFTYRIRATVVTTAGNVLQLTRRVLVEEE